MSALIETLSDGPPEASARLLLAHGAGGPMDGAFFKTFVLILAERGIASTRFEFGYMASRRTGGKRRPPPRAETLAGEYRAAVDQVTADFGTGQRLFIGGKSMGGRVASLIVDELYEAKRAAGADLSRLPVPPHEQTGAIADRSSAGDAVSGLDRSRRARSIRHTRRGRGADTIAIDFHSLGRRWRSRPGPARCVRFHAPRQPRSRSRPHRDIHGRLDHFASAGLPTAEGIRCGNCHTAARISKAANDSTRNSASKPQRS